MSAILVREAYKLNAKTKSANPAEGEIRTLFTSQPSLLRAFFLSHLRLLDPPVVPHALQPASFSTTSGHPFSPHQLLQNLPCFSQLTFNHPPNPRSYGSSLRHLTWKIGLRQCHLLPDYGRIQYYTIQSCGFTIEAN